MRNYQRRPPAKPLSPTAAPYQSLQGTPYPYPSPAPSTPSCQYHPAPNPQCLGCRMAMGGQADSYVASEDFSVQKCYYSDKAPPEIPVAEPLAPLSPMSEDSDSMSPIPGQSDEESYLFKMRYAMQEMDTEIEFVLGDRFLDLGCCPGGFSTYVLSKLPSIMGDGVSLPVELGGHSLAMPQELQSRFMVHWGDMTRFNHAVEHNGRGKFRGLVNFPLPANMYDLVIADGHRPPLTLNQIGHEDRYARDMLLISQILAAVRCVKVGGTIIIKLSLSLANQTLDGFMHRVVIAFGGLSSSIPLVSLKPKSIYATAGSFYILVRGVEAVPRRVLELKLESLWINLLEGGTISVKALNNLVSAKETYEKRAWLGALLAKVQDVRRVARERR